MGNEVNQPSRHLLDEALGLPKGERGRLAAILIESLDPEIDVFALVLQQLGV